jgi:hypothetical protein
MSTARLVCTLGSECWGFDGVLYHVRRNSLTHHSTVGSTKFQPVKPYWGGIAGKFCFSSKPF